MRNEYSRPRFPTADDIRQPNDLSHGSGSVQTGGNLAGERDEASPAPSWHRRHPPGLLARRL